MRILREIMTLLMVTLVAVLIWAFAEAESLRKGEVTVELFFQPEAATDRHLSLKSPAEHIGNTDMVRLTVRLEGTAASVDEAERILRKPLHFKPYDKSLPVTAGEHVLDMRTILADHQDVRRVAASIAAVEPATIPAVVEELVQRDVDVRVDLASGLAEGVPEARPSRVTVRTSRELAQTLPKDLAAIATIDASHLERLIPGRRETIAGVRLSLPPPFNDFKSIRIDPPNIDVLLVLAVRTPTSKPMTVPVQVVLASVEQKRWDITFDQRFQFVPDVTVTGPADVIRQIEDRSVQVVALLQLSFNELEGAAIQTKEVVFTTLPPTQVPLRFEAPSKAVTFSISKRDPAKR
jgi:hypothetical protein